MAEIIEQNKSVIVHKHVDTRTEIEYLKEHVDEIIDNREDYYKGEIIVVNDPTDPSLYVIDTDEQLRKIAGSGTGYDDYEIRGLISGNTESISNLEKNKLDTNTFEKTFNKYTGDTKGILDEALNDIDDLDKDIATHTTRMNQTDADIKTVKGSLTDLITNVSAITKTIEVLNGDATVEGSFAKAIEDTKTVINEYTINSKKIYENPVLDSEDITLNESYLPNMENTRILPGEILTTAIAKLECSLANSMLAIASALNDLDSRIGVPYEYTENGTIIQNATGLCKQIQDLEKKVSELHSSEEFLSK